MAFGMLNIPLFGLIILGATTTEEATFDALSAFEKMVPRFQNTWSGLITLGILIAISMVLWLFTHHAVRPLVLFLIKRSKNKWDDAVAHSGALKRLMILPPLLFLYWGIIRLDLFESPWNQIARRVLACVIILIITRVISAALGAINLIYSTYEISREKPIKSFIQVGQVMVYFIGLILVLSALLHRSPLVFLTGLGAMTAVLMLVFQNSILSLVAGIQLTSTNQIEVGDWIEMPSFDADGYVTDIALNTVTVRNWDNTMSVIPAHNFLQHSFKNWRNVYNMNARRIKREVLIDIHSIRRLTSEEVDELKSIRLLQDYLDERGAAIAAANEELIESGAAPNCVNLRGLTNFGVLRVYMEAYLHQNKNIVSDGSMTLIVRAMEGTPYGIPLQLYAYCNTPSLKDYETVQQDIVDHLLSVLSTFHLRAYQAPTSLDVQGLKPALPPEPERITGPRRPVS